MPSSATVHLDGEPPREVALDPGAATEVAGVVRLHASQCPGVVVEVLRGPARVDGGPAAPGERRLLPPGREARVGPLRVVAGWRPQGTATGARALLGAALRGEACAPGPSLVATAGPAAGRRFPLRSGVLGRGPRASTRLPDPAVSRAHARILLDGDRVRVADLGSTNGTWVGRRRVRGPRPLPPGARLRAGRTELLLALGEPVPEGLPSVPPAAPGRRVRAVLLAAAVAAALAAWALP